MAFLIQIWVIIYYNYFKGHGAYMISSNAGTWSTIKPD